MRHMLSINRRAVLRGTAALAASAVVLKGHGSAFAATEPPPVTDKDHILGDPKAKVTIIEYASLTCPHCAHFAVDILPELKKKYIDTGKVRLIYRNFPLDALAARAAILAKCVNSDQYFAMIDVLFENQMKWMSANDPIAELGKLGRLAGLSDADFKACMDNKSLAESVVAERQGGEAAGVDSTPTMFINGQKSEGALSVEEYDKILQPLLK